MRIRKWLLAVLVAAGLSAATYAVGLYRDAHPEDETAFLFDLLDVGTGAVVAEIGAGQGHMTLAAARLVGPSGKVYSAELDQAQLEALQRSAHNSGVSNVLTVRGSEVTTNLPEGCCDVIFMSKVYHHFTRPREMNASLYKALKPGGRLAVIDFEPRWWRFWLRLPAGVPGNRGGHGMPIGILVEEMTAAGFRLERSISDWWSFPEQRYCLVFQRTESRSWAPSHNEIVSSRHIRVSSFRSRE